ncbi:ribose 5-phosphate isomerase B [Geomicrobium halophilum]|uniref:Ribose 5-phosphate isomerase B n=1 Tax=Geomicrobium halophilum TaxID=549000 RepID=A0A841PRI4_9BACL|nr:ribose 5-phosphate isomerase B [Geomicrobium halophilum]MBB6451389.1 ribose 5-phosphate isomerase B [Geomicrobium halophilum]
MKLAIGSDHHGFVLKEDIKAYIKQMGHEAIDYGCYSCDETDYPDVAFDVSQDIIREKVVRGVLICGTGIGVAIAAGKVPGIRAALCHDTYSAERAQLSNNAQILTMGSKVIGVELAKQVVYTYLNNEFKGGDSARKIKKIMDKENEFLQKI